MEPAPYFIREISADFDFYDCELFSPETLEEVQLLNEALRELSASKSVRITFHSPNSKSGPLLRLNEVKLDTLKIVFANSGLNVELSSNCEIENFEAVNIHNLHVYDCKIRGSWFEKCRRVFYIGNDCDSLNFTLTGTEDEIEIINQKNTSFNDHIRSKFKEIDLKVKPDYDITSLRIKGESASLSMLLENSHIGFDFADESQIYDLQIVGGRTEFYPTKGKLPRIRTHLYDKSYADQGITSFKETSNTAPHLTSHCDTPLIITDARFENSVFPGRFELQFSPKSRAESLLFQDCHADKLIITSPEDKPYKSSQIEFSGCNLDTLMLDRLAIRQVKISAWTRIRLLDIQMSEISRLILADVTFSAYPRFYDIKLIDQLTMRDCNLSEEFPVSEDFPPLKAVEDIYFKLKSQGNYNEATKLRTIINKESFYKVINVSEIGFIRREVTISNRELEKLLYRYNGWVNNHGAEPFKPFWHFMALLSWATILLSSSHYKVINTAPRWLQHQDPLSRLIVSGMYAIKSSLPLPLDGFPVISEFSVIFLIIQIATKIIGACLLWSLFFGIKKKLGDGQSKE